MSIDGIKSAVNAYQAVTTNNSATRQAAEVAGSAAAKSVDFTVQDGTLGSGNTSADDKTTFEAIKKAVNEINRQNPNSTVQFGVHEATNHMTIKILDKVSRKVIKEFPAEKSLDLIAKAWEMAGIMVDEER